MPADRRAEIVPVAGRVREDVVAPVVPHFAVRVHEAVGRVFFDLHRPRLEAPRDGIAVPERPGGRLDLCAVKHAVARINRARGIGVERVGRVVRVRAVHAHEHALLFARFAVLADGHEPQIRRLHHEHAVLVKREAGRAVEIVEEGRAFVRFAVAVGVLENEQLVAVFAQGLALGIVLPRGDPQAAFRVPRHLHGVREFGEFFLVGEKRDRAVRVDLDLFDRLFAVGISPREVGLVTGLVRRDGNGRRHVAVIQFQIAARRDRPHARVAILRHHFALLHFALHHSVVVNRVAGFSVLVFRRVLLA